MMNHYLFCVSTNLVKGANVVSLLKVTDGNIGVEPSGNQNQRHQNTTVVNKQQPLVTVKPDEMPNTGMDLGIGLSILGGLLLVLVLCLIYLGRKKK